MDSSEPVSIDEYEGTWWVRLGRFLRLNRFEVFEVDATSHECIQFILALKDLTYADCPHKSKVLVNTLKRPYSFIYIGYEVNHSKPATEITYIKGSCLGKGTKTLVEIEAFPGKDVSAGIYFGIFVSGAIILGLFVMTLERLLIPTYKLTPDVFCLWSVALFMLFGCYGSLYSNRNSGVDRLAMYLASVRAATHVQSLEEETPLIEEALHQDSVQGSSSH